MVSAQAFSGLLLTNTNTTRCSLYNMALFVHISSTQTLITYLCKLVLFSYKQCVTTGVIFDSIYLLFFDAAATL